MRRPRFYAIETIHPGLRKIHTFRSAKDRDEWVHVRSRESALIGSDRTYRAVKSDNRHIRDAYGFSRRFGVNFAYQEH